jgi:hypothetical protein
VAIVTVSYLLAANVALRTGLLRNAISGSNLGFAFSGSITALRLDYENAYSLMPGRVHVDGLSIRGRERDLEWSVLLDHADADVSMMALFHRTFQATSVRASGLAVRARLRLKRAQATEDVISALPSIDGFDDPPLLDDELPAPPPLTDAQYNLWTLDLEDVDVEHVREVWIHTVRSEGDTRVRGRWLFRPQRWLDIGPATVDSNGVEISYGNRPLVGGLRGSIRATVQAFDIRRMRGLAAFDSVSFTGALCGNVDVAHAVRALMPASGMEIERCEGPFEARMAVDHGMIVPGTRIGTETMKCEVEAGGLALEAPMNMALGIDADVATAEAFVSDLLVSDSGEELARAASIEARLTTHHLHLAHIFDDARFSLVVGDAVAEDVGVWKLPLAKAFVLRSGSLTADAHAEGSFAERRGNVALRWSARRLIVEHSHGRVTADIAGDAQLTDVSLAGAWGSGRATLSADHVTARLGPAVVEGAGVMHFKLGRGAWESRAFDFSGSRGVLRAVSVRSARTGAVLFVVPALSAITPRFALAPSGLSGRLTLDLPGAEFADLGGLRDLLPLPAGFAIENGKGRAAMQAELDLGTGSLRGAARVVAQGLRARAGATELFGDLDLSVRTRRGSGVGASTDFSASALAIANAGTGTPVPTASPWWANVTLRQATLRTSGGVYVDAMVHVRAKDAMPATVLFSQNAGVPVWAANIFRMPALDADAELRISPSSVEICSLTARGGTTMLRAEYTKRNGHQDGAVLMDLGWIGLGYGLADGATGLVLVGADRWFEQKVAAMCNPASAPAHEADVAKAELRSER